MYKLLVKCWPLLTVCVLVS